MKADHSEDKPRKDPRQRSKQAEAERLRAERLATAGLLAAKVSGELRQPLAVVRNSVYFLNLHLGTTVDDKARHHLGIMLRQLDMVTGLVNNLIHLTATRRPRPQEADLEVIVAAAVERLSRSPDITIKTAVEPDLRLECDAEHIRHAVANVVTNSIQAMPDGGTVNITCRKLSRETVIKVTDEGCGMTDETAARAFEPLFSTSPHRLGLGLTIAQRLVGASAGRVEIESRLDKGTTVNIRFPHYGYSLTAEGDSDE